MLDEIRTLINLREQHCIVLSKAAQGIGVTESCLFRLEHGNSHKPKPATLLKIREYISLIKKQHDEEAKSDIEKAIPIILDQINSSYELIPWPSKPRKFQAMVEREGLLFHSVYLRKLTELTGASEDVVIDSLENLCRTGRVKIFGLTISHKIADDNFRIRCELGRGERSLLNRLEIKVVRLYRFLPLRKEELKAKEVLLDIRKIIEGERLKKQRFFDKRHGHADGHVTEFQLRREEREEAAEERDSILSLRNRK